MGSREHRVPPHVRSRGPVDETTSTAGITLVELLAVLAAAGLLTVSLGLLMAGAVNGMRTLDARARIMENLMLAAERISGDLRRLARSNPAVSAGSFHLGGIDADGTYENARTDPHDATLTTRVNRDRLHLHLLDRDARLRGSCGSGGVCSERVYHAYWITGPESQNPVHGLRNTWGLARRRRRHTSPGDTLPVVGGRLSPLFDLDNRTPSNRSGAGPVAFGIDGLSVRFFDPLTSRWVNCWDTTGSAPRPSSCHPPDGDHLPAAVQFALRGYDRRGRGEAGRRHVRPFWYETTVDLR